MRCMHMITHLVPSGPSLSATVFVGAFFGCSGTSRKSDAKAARCLSAVCVTTSKQKLRNTSHRLSGTSIQPNSVLKNQPEMPAVDVKLMTLICERSHSSQNACTAVTGDYQHGDYQGDNADHTSCFSLLVKCKCIAVMSDYLCMKLARHGCRVACCVCSRC